MGVGNVLLGLISKTLVFAIFIYLYTNAQDLKVNSERINLFGNSAGGHLVAMMVATRWPEIDPKLPDDLIKSAAMAAKRDGQEGKWLFTLHKPSWIPFLQFSSQCD